MHEQTIYKDMIADSFLTELDALFSKLMVKNPMMSCQSDNRIGRFYISESFQADPCCCHNEKCKVY